MLDDTKTIRPSNYKFYALINSSGAYPPPGNRRAFAHVVSPGGGAFAILSQPGGWALAYPGATPGHLTQVFSKDGGEAFVKDWLVCQGLEKSVDILKICFLNLWYFFIACKQISISDKVNYILVITKQSLTWTLREHDYFAFRI